MKFRFKIYLILLFLSFVAAILFIVWSPGEYKLINGKGFTNNGIWISHGWIGDDKWFIKYKKSTGDFDSAAVRELKIKVNGLKIRYLFPHLCPANGKGMLPGIDELRLETLRLEFNNVLILPWVGGSTDSTVELESNDWKDGFVNSISDLLKNKNVDGVHINIEPMPTGNRDFIELLERINSIKGSKILSVASYPPPSILHPFKEVHWDLSYYKEVSGIADQIVPMLYDTALKNGKIYTWLLGEWTKEIINSTNGKNVLFGIPAYEDSGVGYHDPRVENIKNSVPGVIHGINSVPDSRNFGISVYSEWTLNDNKINQIEKLIQ